MGSRFPGWGLTTTLAMMVGSCVPFFERAAYVNVPFEAGRSGAVMDTQFDVPSERPYWFYVELISVPENGVTYQDLMELVDMRRGIGRDASGQTPKGIGIQIPIKVSLDRLAPNPMRLVDQREFSDLETAAWGGESIDKLIFADKLEQGRYRLVVTALADLPALARFKQAIVVRTRLK